MPISYTNRKNETRYLRAARTKKGKLRYYIVKNIEKYKEEDLVSEFPEGYEFYEFPEDARIVFRKKINPIFTDEEAQIIADIMDKQETVEQYIIDRTEKHLCIYIAPWRREDFSSVSDEYYNSILPFDLKLHFIKKEPNLYVIKRFTNFGDYGWIPLETSKDLKYLAEKYCYHIDKESLIDFWIEGEDEPVPDVLYVRLKGEDGDAYPVIFHSLNKDNSLPK